MLLIGSSAYGGQKDGSGAGMGGGQGAPETTPYAGAAQAFHMQGQYSGYGTQQACAVGVAQMCMSEAACTCACGIQVPPDVDAAVLLLDMPYMFWCSAGPAAARQLWWVWWLHRRRVRRVWSCAQWRCLQDAMSAAAAALHQRLCRYAETRTLCVQG